MYTSATESSQPADSVVPEHQAKADAHNNMPGSSSPDHNGKNSNKSASVILNPPSYARLTSQMSSHRVMFTQKYDDPMRDNMAISIISMFFCCIIGFVAIFKASKAMDHARREDVEAAHLASLSARKYAMTAIVVGLVLYFVSLFANVFLIRKGDYKTERYGHFHLKNDTLR